jgi:hypothetical protein
MQSLRKLHVDGHADTVSPCDTCVEWAWWKPQLRKSFGNYNAVLLEDKKPSDGGAGSSQ